jgi:uncharacterized membrane protein YphA (DoxX/SURF4 family)
MKKFIHTKLFKFIWTVGVALLFFWLCPPCFNKTTLMIILASLVVILNVFPYFSASRGFYWFTQLTRILVGCLFIFSGFIKSNDPIGFSYKLEEYFEVFKTDTGFGFFEWFAHISLPLAVIICVSEVALGFLLLLGFKRNLTLWLLLAQIVFFTFLTFYSACYNKVTHCGCFGDFIKLTPWESFWKDIALLIAISVLFVGKDHINEFFGTQLSNVVTVIVIGASIWFPVYNYRNLPVLDFRPYAPGVSICEGMKPGPNYKAAVYESHFMYKNIQSGDTVEFTDKNYPWQDTLHWKYHRALGSQVVSPAIDEAKITDFAISDQDGNVITDSLLNIKGYHFFLICYDLDKTEQDPELMARINDFYTLCEKDHINFVAITSSSTDQISQFKHKHNAMYNFYTADGTVLKTMIRSNPGLMLLKECYVITNWHNNNFPVYSDVKANYFK